MTLGFFAARGDGAWAQPEHARKLRVRLGLDPGHAEHGRPWYPEFRDQPGEDPGDGAQRLIRDLLQLKHPRTGVLQMWRFQKALIGELYAHKKVAVTSSRSTSKTHTLGHLAAAFLLQEPSRVLIVTPTMRQGIKGVMGEMRAALTRATDAIPFAANNASEVRLDERHWAMVLPSRDPDAMRGFHASPDLPGDPDADTLSEEDIAWMEEQASDTSTRLLVIVDEAPGVPSDAFNVLSGMFTKPNVYGVLSGNPTLGADDDHDYVRAFRSGSSWRRLRVSSLDPAEFPAPSSIEYDATFWPVPEYLVQPSDIEAALAQYGRDEPILISDWAGTFPTGSSAWNVVPRTALEAALAAGRTQLQPLGPRIGVDIGTGSPDLCCASLFVDGEKRTEHLWAPEKDDQEGQLTIAMTIKALAAKWGAEIEGVGPGRSRWDGSPIPGDRISVDDSGLVGVCDILAGQGVYVDRVNFARRASGQWRELVGTQRFTNIRTEMHWVARRGLQEGVFRIPQQFTRSWSQAQWTRFERSFDSKGPVIKLESKDQVVKRHGHSPDTWDADILAMRRPALDTIAVQTGGFVVTPTSGQPIRNGRLRPTKLKGGRRIG